MEIKPLVIGVGTERRLVLHFVELDLRAQRALVSLTVKDRWLRVEDFGGFCLTPQKGKVVFIPANYNIALLQMPKAQLFPPRIIDLLIPT